MKCVRHICYNVTNKTNTRHANAQQIDFSFDFEYNMCAQVVYIWCVSVHTPNNNILLLPRISEFPSKHLHNAGKQTAMHLISDLFSICIIMNRVFWNAYMDVTRSTASLQCKCLHYSDTVIYFKIQIAHIGHLGNRSNVDIYMPGG